MPFSIPGILFGSVIADEKQKYPNSIPWYSIWHCTVLGAAAFLRMTFGLKFLGSAEEQFLASHGAANQSIAAATRVKIPMRFVWMWRIPCTKKVKKLIGIFIRSSPDATFHPDDALLRSGRKFGFSFSF